jgi:hypothetical protein
VPALEAADVYSYNGHKDPVIEAIYKRAFAETKDRPNQTQAPLSRSLGRWYAVLPTH